MRSFLVVLVLGAAAVLEAKTPPLATHTYVQPPEEPRLDWGLSSINTHELWEK